MRQKKRRLAPGWNLATVVTSPPRSGSIVLLSINLSRGVESMLVSCSFTFEMSFGWRMSKRDWPVRSWLVKFSVSRTDSDTKSRRPLAVSTTNMKPSELGMISCFSSLSVSMGGL